MQSPGWKITIITGLIYSRRTWRALRLPFLAITASKSLLVRESTAEGNDDDATEPTLTAVCMKGTVAVDSFACWIDTWLLKLTVMLRCGLIGVETVQVKFTDSLLFEW